jgi:hypothetical protein
VQKAGTFILGFHHQRQYFFLVSRYRKLKDQDKEGQRFRKGIRIWGWGRNAMFFQTTVPRLDRLGLPVKGKTPPSRQRRYFPAAAPAFRSSGWIACWWLCLA